MKYRLGLDLGTNSIGWAIIEVDENGNPIKIIAAGSRIFSNGRDPQSKSSLAEARRLARSARRRRDRFLQRKHKLFKFLLKTNFIPQNNEFLEKLKDLNPYFLRHKCINQKAEKHEIARALYHICQRRGFKSSRKDTAETGGAYKKAISDLENAINETESKTLGEFLYKRQQNKDRVRTTVKMGAQNKPIYDLIPTREMYLNEVKLILDNQKQYHPEINDVFIKKITGFSEEDTIFYQRNLKPADIGVCQVYITEPRAHRALPSYQLYCLEQDLFNLEIISPKGISTKLSDEQKKILKNDLSKAKDRTKEKIKDLLDLDEGFELNLTKDKYKGLSTEIQLRKNFFGKQWDELSLTEKDEIVQKIIDTDEDTSPLLEITQRFDFNSEKTQEFLTLNEDKLGVKSYCTLSSKALIEGISIAHAENQNPSEVIKILKQAHNPDSTLTTEALLPYYGKLLQESVVKRSYTAEQLKQVSFNEEEYNYGKISNPTVHIVLRQTQKVVNKIIEKYGKPNSINLEIIRELKMSKEQKSKLEKEQNKNKKANERYKQMLEENGLENNYTNRLKLKLWEELGPVEDRKCPYSFPEKQINMETLFSPQVEIEHILPFSKTLDDSVNNKTIAFRTENKLKGNRSPYDAFKDNSEKYDAILQRVQLINNTRKRKRFYPDAMDKFKDQNEFLARQLTDTAYIARITRRYLGTLLNEKQVQVSPGRLTALLRHHWGLNSILSSEDKDQKNRTDHRHHALDAIVIALSSMSMLQKISKANARSQDLHSILIPEPMTNLRSQAENVISNIIVSHRPDHGIEGRLHEDTSYGIRYANDPAEKPKKISNTFDEYFKAPIKFSVTTKHPNNIKTEIVEKNNFLKIIKHGKNKKHYKAVNPGENYSLEFWSFQEKIYSLPISYFDANRLKTGKYTYNQLRKEYNVHPAAKKNYEFKRGDCIELTNEKNNKEIYMVVGLVPSGNSIEIRPINLNDKIKLKRSISVLIKADLKKVKLDELGYRKF